MTQEQVDSLNSGDKIFKVFVGMNSGKVIVSEIYYIVYSSSRQDGGKIFSYQHGTNFSPSMVSHKISELVSTGTYQAFAIEGNVIGEARDLAKRVMEERLLEAQERLNKAKMALEHVSTDVGDYIEMEEFSKFTQVTGAVPTP